ncbi:MAG: phospholipase D family protein [Deltaproteobacteria bacterium]|nr:phospholipase D family protein [Deltaproteobacteria bacterium]
MHRTIFIILFSCVCACAEKGNTSKRDYCQDIQRRETTKLSAALAPLAVQSADKTGVYVLEDGENAMVARAWLTEAAERTIDIQYFIFSADNVGLIACDYLLRAADRGVKVRVIVDDLLVDADADQLLALDAHENLQIKIYNPNINLGKSLGASAKEVLSDFRGINQRMHNKTAIADGKVVITGGRNIANEYFDYDHEYNFRDREVLLVGGVASDVQKSFDTYWNDALSVDVIKVVKPSEPIDSSKAFEALHQYACNPDNYWPQVREKARSVPEAFEKIRNNGLFKWVENVRFVWDVPGKNQAKKGLGGGGATTDELIARVKEAKTSIVIQTPYLVTTKLSRGLFTEAVQRGVTVKILTNSLASTDNLTAFSGYQRDRKALLKTGIEVYEWRPDAAVRQSIMASALTDKIERQPIFGLHAKTMVVDERLVIVGTFNLDPRSANLNTECITIIQDEDIARHTLVYLNREMQPENAWHTTQSSNPDGNAGAWKRIKLIAHRIVPKSIL